ncbi:MAG: hypothetical protein V4674_01805 [Patescibacteria group bacterium]
MNSPGVSNLSLYLPSKKIRLLAFALFIASGAIFLASQPPKQKVATLEVVFDEPKKEASSFVQPPSDWLASLDNTLPKEEAKSFTETDRFAQKFLSKYAELKQSGALSKETEAALASSLIAELEAGKPARKIYSERDITILETASTDAILLYRERLNNSIAKYSYKTLGNELDAVQLSFKSGTAVGTDMLTRAGAAYANIAKSLLLVPVPKELVALHLLFINDFAVLADTSETMTVAHEDPIAATLALEEYHTSSQRIVAALALKL